MNREKISKKLDDIDGQIRSIFVLFNDKGVIPRHNHDLARNYLDKLKSDLELEYKKFNRAISSPDVRSDEGAFYAPAIRDFWVSSRLSSLRRNSIPDHKWISTLEHIKMSMHYWKNQIQSKSAA